MAPPSYYALDHDAIQILEKAGITPPKGPGRSASRKGQTRDDKQQTRQARNQSRDNRPREWIACPKKTCQGWEYMDKCSTRCALCTTPYLFPKEKKKPKAGKGRGNKQKPAEEASEDVSSGSFQDTEDGAADSSCRVRSSSAYAKCLEEEVTLPEDHVTWSPRALLEHCRGAPARAKARCSQPSAAAPPTADKSERALFHDANTAAQKSLKTLFEKQARVAELHLKVEATHKQLRAEAELLGAADRDFATYRIEHNKILEEQKIQTERAKYLATDTDKGAQLRAQAEALMQQAIAADAEETAAAAAKSSGATGEQIAPGAMDVSTTTLPATASPIIAASSAASGAARMPSSAEAVQAAKLVLQKHAAEQASADARPQKSPRRADSAGPNTRIPPGELAQQILASSETYKPDHYTAIAASLASGLPEPSDIPRPGTEGQRPITPAKAAPGTPKHRNGVKKDGKAKPKAGSSDAGGSGKDKDDKEDSDTSRSRSPVPSKSAAKDGQIGHNIDLDDPLEEEPPGINATQLP